MRREYYLAWDEGNEGQADLLHGHAQSLVSLVHTADMDQEVTNPAQAEHEVEDKLSDEEGHQGGAAVGVAIARSHRV